MPTDPGLADQISAFRAEHRRIADTARKGGAFLRSSKAMEERLARKVRDAFDAAGLVRRAYPTTNWMLAQLSIVAGIRPLCPGCACCLDLDGYCLEVGCTRENTVAGPASPSGPAF